MIHSQLHLLANTGIDRVLMNNSWLDYTRIDTNSPFCHPSKTAELETKWLASNKKAGPSLAHPIFPNSLPTGSDCCFEEVQSYIT